MGVGQGIDPVDGDPPGVGTPQPGDYGNERRLSRPVGSEKTEDLARSYVEADPAERP